MVNLCNTVRISSGRRLAPQPLTVAVVLNLKELSLDCSICWSLELTKYVPYGRLSTVRIFRTWPTYLLLSWSSSLLSISKASVLCFQWDQGMPVGSKVHIQLNCFTHRICPSFCTLHWLPTSTSYLRYILRSQYISSISLYVCESANMFLLLLQLLYRKFSGNFLVNLIGIWKESEYSCHSIPVGGFAYYVTAPSRWMTIFYITTLFFVCPSQVTTHCSW